MCDLGTGCGIIPLLMSRKNPPRHIYAVDIQKQAIDQLDESLKISEISNITPICADLKELWENAPLGTLDVVTCNPPYKINNTGAKNDSEAVSIARHEMLCTIDDVCRCAKKNLKFGGRLCICNRPERLCDIMTAMRASGIEPKRLRTVHKNPECPPWLILVEGKKGGKPFVQIEKPLYVRSADGGNSAEMKRIYGLE